jgi:hypothetical protein
MKSCRCVPVLAAACFVLLSGIAAAGEMPFGVGVKAGVNESQLTGSYADVIHAKYETGYVVGAFLCQDLGPSLGLQEEALFNAQRSTGDHGVRVDLQYVEVPVLLRFSVLPGPVKPFVYAGPSFGFKLSGKVTQSGEPDIDIKDRLRPMETSVAAGAGVRLDLGGLGVIGDVRYLANTQDILKSGDVISVRVNTWTLSAGILF